MRQQPPNQYATYVVSLLRHHILVVFHPDEIEEPVSPKTFYSPLSLLAKTVLRLHTGHVLIIATIILFRLVALCELLSR